MKLFAHLIRADVRQFRWAILLWLVLVAADTTLTAARPALLTDSRSYGNVSMILGLLELAQHVGMVLLAVLVIQAHPAVGTDAFWLTRPVPPRTLVVSKIVLISTLLIVIPCTARAALMLSVHVPVRYALFNAIDSAIGRAVWLAVVTTGAVVTSNFSRFALLCATALVSLVLTFVVLLTLSRNEVFSSAPGVMPRSPDPTQLILAALCVTGAALLLAGIQYRTRLRRVSVPAGAVTVALALFAIPYWPFPVLRAPSALPAWTSDPGTVPLRAASPVIEMNPEGGSEDGGPAFMSGWTRVIVSLPGRGWWVPRLALLDASVMLETGATLQSWRRGANEFAPAVEGSSDDPVRVVARQVLGVEHLLMPKQYAESSGPLLVLPINHVAMPAPAQYSGRFAASLAHWEVATVLPLRVGAVFQEDNFRFAVGQVIIDPWGRLAVRAREWHATSSFDRRPRISYGFYVRNAQQTHAMAGSESDLSPGASPFSFFFPVSSGAREGSDERGVVVFFYLRNEAESRGIDWNPDWYPTSELVIVRVTDAGAVLRTLDIPQASLVAKKR